MDRAYANALKRKEELENELAKISVFLDMYRHFSGPEREQTEPNINASVMPISKESGSSPPRRRLRPHEIAVLAERVIRGADEPLTRAEIVTRLESAGVELHSDDKPRYVGTILWREKDRFINLAGRGYVTSDMAARWQGVEKADPIKETGEDHREQETPTAPKIERSSE